MLCLFLLREWGKDWWVSRTDAKVCGQTPGPAMQKPNLLTVKPFRQGFNLLEKAASVIWSLCPQHNCYQGVPRRTEHAPSLCTSHSVFLSATWQMLHQRFTASENEAERNADLEYRCFVYNLFFSQLNNPCFNILPKFSLMWYERMLIVGDQIKKSLIFRVKNTTKCT